jgi:squalene-associated FAD-dependent desaturase
MKVLIAGAGWAGLACAIELTKAGHQVTVIEASRHLGGRARRLALDLPDGTSAELDNGQHILIGAYSETLRLMREVSVNVQEALHRMPLTLTFPNGDALQLPDWKKPLLKGLDVAWGVLQANGWTWADKFSLLRTAAAWRMQGFSCEEATTVSQLCQHVSAPVMQMLIEPLCVSALNTPANRASGQVFLRIMRDSLFASAQPGLGSSNLLLPRCDLGTIFPQVAEQWLIQQGAKVGLGHRLMGWKSLSNHEHSAHISSGPEADFYENFDAIVIATAPVEAARLARSQGHVDWAQITDHLHHEAIATVYAYAPNAQLPCPMMALASSDQAPAQFVFDRGSLTGHTGVLAFVISAAQGEAQLLEAQTIAQGREQLKLPDLHAIKTIVDKRATFACTPGLKRPSMQISSGIFACGDYVDGPYPSTLEGAVRSGMAAAQGIRCHSF